VDCFKIQAQKSAVDRVEAGSINPIAKLIRDILFKDDVTVILFVSIMV